MKQRVCFPGSDWLYFKFYASSCHIDNILINDVANYVDMLTQQNWIEKWFFVRYADPNPHLRLRLKLRSTQNYSTAILYFSEIFKNELSNGGIWDVKIDTYKRELERYGADRIDDIESIFQINSTCTINLLKRIASFQDKDNIRWLLGLSLIDSFFDSFDYDLDRRCYIMETISNSFMEEFGFIGAIHTKQLNDQYRVNRSLIEQIMVKESDELGSCFLLIKKHTSAISNIFSTISKKSLDHLIISLIHMCMNRLFLSYNRANEVVLYYFLLKYYKSYKARK